MAARSLLERIQDEPFVSVFDSNLACQTCLFARGEPSWPVPDGWELTPDKCNCQIYEPDGIGDKPVDVACHGAECEYYEPADSV
jgi:hypothetical protein